MPKYQTHNGGNLFELLAKKILISFKIDIDILDFETYPDLQNMGIDALITSPDKFKETSIQIKMFKNVKKYGTFPWEVSRFLRDSKDFILEPHTAKIHLIIDPVQKVNSINFNFYCFQTKNKPLYFQELWNDATNEFGIPSESNQHWVTTRGQYEPYFKLEYKNETLYQLIKEHTAYQRNVRFRIKNFTDIIHFDLNLEGSLEDILNQNSMQILESLKNNNSSDNIKIIEKKILKLLEN